jgi:hypothetical protein
VADEQLRGSERYLDEVEPSPPPRWRTMLALGWCLTVPIAIVVVAKVFLFEEMSTVDFAIRSAICGIVVLALWLTIFRRRIVKER